MLKLLLFGTNTYNPNTLFHLIFLLKSVRCCQILPGTRTFWTTGHSDHALTRGDWRFTSPRLRLGIVASLLSVSTGSQHIVWLVYTVPWEQWISSSIGSILPNSMFKKSLTVRAGYRVQIFNDLADSLCPLSYIWLRGHTSFATILRNIVSLFKMKVKILWHSPSNLTYVCYGSFPPSF